MNRPEQIFVDANVIFSATIGSRVCQMIFRLPDICLLTSDYCISEVERNLDIKGYARANELELALHTIQVVPTPPPSEWNKAALWLPERAKSNIPILAAALVARADLLVTGNTRDFARLIEAQSSPPIEVLTPRGLLERGPRRGR